MVVNPGEAEVVAGYEAGPATAGAPLRQANLWRDAARRYVRNRGAVLAAVVFALVVLFAIVTPFVSPYEARFCTSETYPVSRQAPSLAHPFGTDQCGRDLMTRTAEGGRISIGIGFGATIAILWEFAEYVTFVRNSPELATAYTDTLGDLALGLTGSCLAAAVTAWFLWPRRPGKG